MKRVLLLHGSGGMGHIKAADSLYAAFRDKYPDIGVENINVLDFSPKIFHWGFDESYNFMSSITPPLWGALYRYYDVKRKESQLTHLLSRVTTIESKLVKFIEEYIPDVIISTHPFPMQLISYTKKHHIIGIPSVNIPTDYGCHRFWINEDVNLYCVATDGVGKCVEKHGVSPDKIVVTGIPIHKKFSGVFKKSELREKYDIPKSARVLFLIGGQTQHDDMLKIVKNFLNEGEEMYAVVVSGRDKRLQGYFNDHGMSGHPRLRLFGFVDNIEEFMAISDLIFSKAGGLTVSECMAMRLPMIIRKVIPGQEEHNMRFLVGRGSAIHIKRVKNIASGAAEILRDARRLEEMKKACDSIRKPDAAYSIAERVYEQFKLSGN